MLSTIQPYILPRVRFLPPTTVTIIGNENGSQLLFQLKEGEISKNFLHPSLISDVCFLLIISFEFFVFKT